MGCERNPACEKSVAPLGTSGNALLALLVSQEANSIYKRAARATSKQQHGCWKAQLQHHLHRSLRDDHNFAGRETQQAAGCVSCSQGSSTSHHRVFDRPNTKKHDRGGSNLPLILLHGRNFLKNTTQHVNKRSRVVRGGTYNFASRTLVRLVPRHGVWPCLIQTRTYNE